MINILGKINKDNYKEFVNSDFFGYEVFLGSESDFKYLPEMMQQLNIISVHQPGKDFNLCSEQEIGNRSFNIMLKMLSLLNENGYKGIVVVHGALFDEIISSKEKHLKILAGRIDKLAESFLEIKITLENDAWFFNQSGSNCALLVESADFLELKKYLRTRLYITLDFEHIWISSIFRDFVKNNLQFYTEIKSLKDLAKPEVITTKKIWLSYLQENKKRIDKIVLGFLKEYEKLKSSIINFHLNGSNMSKYWFNSETFTPLQGEHLRIKGASDVLNHGLIKNNIKALTDCKKINLILEIWPRKINQYVLELKKSGQVARKLYAE